MQQADSQLEATGGGFQKLGAVGTAAIAGLAVKVISDFGRMAFGMAETGAGFMQLQDAGTQMASTLGGNFEEIVAKITDASLGMVSQADIVQSTNRAMMLGLGADADKLASLMEVAAFRGRAMGLDTTQAFNDIVTGVGRMSPMILDNLGIVVDSATVYGEYAASIGKAADELTGAEKRQALLNAVLAEGQVQLDAAGGLSENAASNFQQFDAAVANLTSIISEGLVPVATDLLEIITPLIEGVIESKRTHDDLIETYGEEAVQVAILTDNTWGLAEASAVLEGDMEGATQAAEDQGSAYENLVNIMRGREADAARWAGLASEYAVAAGDAAAASDDLADSVLAVGEAFAKGMPDTEDFYTMMIQSAWAQGKSAEELGALALAMGVADEAAVQVILGQAALQDQMDAGVVSAQRLVLISQALATYEAELALAEEAAARGSESEAEAHRNAAGDALEHFSALTMTTGALGEATAAADGYVATLNRIPSTLTTHLQLTGVEHVAEVTAAYGGGMAEGYQQGTTWVPRTGLAMVHAGEEIVPRGRMGGAGGRTIILAPIIMEKSEIEAVSGELNAEALIGAILEQVAM